MHHPRNERDAYPVPILIEIADRAHRANDPRPQGKPFTHSFLQPAVTFAPGGVETRLEKRPRCPLHRGKQRGAKRTNPLIARVLRGRLFDLSHDAAEIVGLRRLERRELLERRQMREPQLLTDRQEVPVVQEGSGRTAERTADGVAPE